MRSALALVLALVALVASPWAAAPAHADPVPTTVTLSAASFRPAPDGFQDTLVIRANVDPTATSVTLTVDPGVATWTLTPDPTTHQVSVTWDGKGTGPNGFAPAGTHPITATAHTPTGDLVGSASATVLIDVVPATAIDTLNAKFFFAQNFSARCGKLAMPSAHHWPGSIGVYADGRCNSGGRKNFSDAAFGARPHRQIDGHTVSSFTNIRLAVYGAAAPSANRSVGLLAYETTSGHIYGSPTRLPAHAGWHSGPVVPASSLMSDDDGFGWEIATLGHSRYDVKQIRITLSYTYLY